MEIKVIYQLYHAEDFDIHKYFNFPNIEYSLREMCNKSIVGLKI